MLRRMCYTHIDSVLVDLDDVVVDVHVDHVHGVARRAADLRRGKALHRESSFVDTKTSGTAP